MKAQTLLMLFIAGNTLSFFCSVSGFFIADNLSHGLGVSFIGLSVFLFVGSAGILFGVNPTHDFNGNPRQITKHDYYKEETATQSPDYHSTNAHEHDRLYTQYPPVKRKQTEHRYPNDGSEY